MSLNEPDPYSVPSPAALALYPAGYIAGRARVSGFTVPGGFIGNKRARKPLIAPNRLMT